MAKIKITGVSYDQSNYTIMVTLVVPRVIDNEDVEMPIGEAAVRFPSTMEIEDVKKLIVKTAEEIWHSHINAVDKTEDIAQMDFPDIP